MHTELFVQYNSFIEDSWSSGESFGSWREEKSFDVAGVSLSTKSYQEEHFTVDDDIKVGDVVHVLYVIYSSGDSFGSSTGNGEVLWVFKDLKLARRAQKVWEENADEYTVSFLTDGGNSVKLSNPASGYFEDVSYFDIVSFIVEE